MQHKTERDHLQQIQLLSFVNSPNFKLEGYLLLGYFFQFP